ncbi:OadG family protein [Mesoaciditoga sp.]
MEKTWTISIVGIIVALGGLGFIAIFFAIVGHFFHKSAQKKAANAATKATSSVKRDTKVPEKAVKGDKNVQSVPVQNSVDDSELIAVLSAAIASFEGVKAVKVISARRMDESKPRSMWRFHNPQVTWRTVKRK